MRISHHNKFVYLAIPRTGSVSMRKLLDGASDVRSVHENEVTPEHPFYNHIPARELREIFRQRAWDWDGYTRFCVVRNPYDRVVSVYHFCMSHLDEVRSAGLRGWWRRCFTTKPNFRKFVSSIDPTRRMPTSLGNFINDAEGRPLVDDVLRFEDLAETLPGFLEGLGIAMPPDGLPHVNSSKQRRDYRSYYDDETRERIGQLYREEIERFGYSF